jgi:transcriptional regulator with XRE-family HTH domain
LTRTAAATAARLERERSNPRAPAPGAAGLGDRLRNLRVERGLSAAELAELSLVSAATIVKLEAGGGWTGKTAEALARALGVSVKTLAFGGEPMESFEAGLWQDGECLQVAGGEIPPPEVGIGDALRWLNSERRRVKWNGRFYDSRGELAAALERAGADPRWLA